MVIIVLILILLVSSTNIFTQFIDLIFPDKVINTVESSNIKDISFPAVLLKADQLYKEGNYKEAQGEYLVLSSLSSLSNQQKAVAHFRLGLCNYKLNLYDIAAQSFIKAASFNPSDAVAYNNAAVCLYYMKDFERAKELQRKAISRSPVVEYYYNLARICETLEDYMEAVKYFIAVDHGEGNITRDDGIDPVRIKNKIMKLKLRSDYTEEISKDLMMIALKLKDAREVFVIEDANMDIKSNKFQWSVKEVNGTKRLYCSYDREESDPYTLIDSLEWTVKTGGRVIYTSNRDNFNIRINDQNDYVVSLDITYNGMQHTVGHVDITNNKAFEEKDYTDSADEKCKYYEYALYEQVFDSNFEITTRGYTDRFNTQWGMDSGVETEIMEKDFIDAQRALYIKNSSGGDAGIWADLTALINDKQLKGKTIGIRFYARKITGDANLNVNFRVKTGDQYKNTPRKYNLDYKWKKMGFDVLIPENAEGMTISITTRSGEEVKLDGFTISIVR